MFKTGLSFDYSFIITTFVLRALCILQQQSTMDLYL